MKTFSIKESLRYGWETFKKRPSLFILAGLVLLVIHAILSVPDHAGEDAVGTAAAVFGILSLVAMLLSFLADIGTTHFLLRAHDSVETTSLRSLWFPKPYWRFLGAGILTFLIIVAGLILLIVPGVIAMLALSFVGPLVIDKELGPVEAIKESARLTKGHRWHLLLFWFAVLGLNILGFCALIVGLFVTLPVSGLAAMHVYRKLAELKSIDLVPVPETAAA